jgi:hypothetical protein
MKKITMIVVSISIFSLVASPVAMAIYIPYIPGKPLSPTEKKEEEEKLQAEEKYEKEHPHKVTGLNKAAQSVVDGLSENMIYIIGGFVILLSIPLLFLMLARFIR